jgi:oxygen-independent coproporphyrinogen-3 oxidase
MSVMLDGLYLFSKHLSLLWRLQMANKPNSLILDLHIPYCIQPENYLDHFNAMGTNFEKNMYLSAMMREVLSYEGELEGYEIRAIRLGGGSATVMKPDLLGQLLTLIRQKLPVAKGAEISFDALPNTIGTPSLTGIAAGHPTRAELMMRSENDKELRTLNCAYTMQHTRNAMLFFHKFHLNNVGLTVNYGIPGQTMQSWHNTLHACVIMHPNHIHVEPLAVTDAPDMPDEALRFEMYDHACTFLAENGYTQYAAGQFSLPHHEYLFEALRMNGTPCIGMGVAAVSAFDGYVTRNTNNCGLYIKNAGNFEKLTAQVFQADPEFLMKQYALGRLGLTQGLSTAAFEERFACGMPEGLTRSLEQLVQKGWIAEADGSYLSSREGLFHYPEYAEIFK